jgi:hypothetical protein
MGARGARVKNYGWAGCSVKSADLSVCVFITAGPITKLCAWGEEDSGGHVL